MRRFAPFDYQSNSGVPENLIIGGPFMSKSSNRIKDILFDCVNSMSENPWIHTDQINHFSRKRKIPFSDTILSTICMQRSSSKKEILNYYDFRTDTPTHSALIQQRNKLKPSAFEDLFYRFTNAVTPDLRYKGYRLFAVDGSDIYIPRNPVSLMSMARASTCSILMPHTTWHQSCIPT